MPLKQSKLFTPELLQNQESQTPESFMRTIARNLAKDPSRLQSFADLLPQLQARRLSLCARAKPISFTTRRTLFSRAFSSFFITDHSALANLKPCTPSTTFTVKSTSTLSILDNALNQTPRLRARDFNLSRFVLLNTTLEDICPIHLCVDLEDLTQLLTLVHKSIIFTGTQTHNIQFVLHPRHKRLSLSTRVLERQ